MLSIPSSWDENREVSAPRRMMRSLPVGEIEFATARRKATIADVLAAVPLQWSTALEIVTLLDVRGLDEPEDLHRVLAQLVDRGDIETRCAARLRTYRDPTKAPARRSAANTARSR